jgi:hypothetical protein
MLFVYIAQPRLIPGFSTCNRNLFTSLQTAYLLKGKILFLWLLLLGIELPRLELPASELSS